MDLISQQVAASNWHQPASCQWGGGGDFPYLGLGLRGICLEFARTHAVGFGRVQSFRLDEGVRAHLHACQGKAAFAASASVAKWVGWPCLAGFARAQPLPACPTSKRAGACGAKGQPPTVSTGVALTRAAGFPFPLCCRAKPAAHLQPSPARALIFPTPLRAQRAHKGS